MIIPDIVVAGASAGGVEALSAFFGDMPCSAPIVFFVALHRSPQSRSWLPSILERTGRLPAEHPREGDKISPGRIYVAPPDFHLVVTDKLITDRNLLFARPLVLGATRHLNSILAFQHIPRPRPLQRSRVIIRMSPTYRHRARL